MSPHRGKVESFDRDAGLGELRSEEGQLYPFHCTEITDSSRDIAVGAGVDFDIVPGHLGKWEAKHVARREGEEREPPPA